LSIILKRIICKFVGYYENGQIYLFDFSSGTANLKLVDSTYKTPKILILSRENYSEKHIEYPVVEKKSLNKLLALEYGGGNVKFIVTDVGDTKASVNIWRFNDELPKSFFLVPETFLFQHTLGNKQVLVKECEQGELYVSTVGFSVVSILKSVFVNSVERFCMSTGLGSYAAVNVPKNKVANYLLNGFIKSNKQHLLSFFSLDRTNEEPVKWLSLINPAVILTIIYLFSSSMWLLWDKHAIESSFQEKKSEMVQVLNIQDEYLKLSDQLKILNSFILKQQETSSIWILLSEIIDDTKITIIRYNDKRFLIVGTTNKATTLLEKISNLPYIVDAQFDMPIRKTKNLENYSISFALDNDITIQEGL